MASEKRVQQPWPEGPSPDRLGVALAPKLQVQGTQQLHASLRAPRTRQDGLGTVPAGGAARAGTTHAAAASNATAAQTGVSFIYSDLFATPPPWAGLGGFVYSSPQPP